MRVFLRKTYAPTTCVTIAILKVGIRMVIYFDYNSLSYVHVKKMAGFDHNLSRDYAFPTIFLQQNRFSS